MFVDTYNIYLRGYVNILESLYIIIAILLDMVLITRYDDYCSSRLVKHRLYAYNSNTQAY